ncbi:P-loop NTPase fold protein [Priestia aryabhattai]|uniref:P-loop NTPase fold protein n=1 Tax=Priestia aryabhattai TaxID=412384 RepID=UPI0027E59EBD|nr:P-loop NTPase fold protein [Priestia aryabhattai]WJW97226.1 P-loop NTPase fold protein [Priestia aryabhattai]
MKKIYINYEVLKESPLEEVNKDILYFKENLDNMKQELLKGPPNCYMVSGYRGTGKTSYINIVKGLIEQEVKEKKNNEKFLFVKINITSGDTKTNILRKIIRGLSNEFLRQANFNQELPKKFSFFKFIKKIKLITKEHSNSDEKIFKKYLELLYKQTFGELTVSEVESKIKDSVGKLNIDPSIIIVISLIALLSFFYIFLDLLNISKILKFFEFLKFNKMDKLLVPFISFFLSISLLIKINVERVKQKKSVNEYSYKTLYDDEIAEYKLKEAIEAVINIKKYKLVFVIDELDKIDEDNELRNLLGQLKSILLESKATFILVAGQKFYYLYELEQINEDPLLLNLISKYIHISLPTTREFEDLFKKFIKNPKKSIPAYDGLDDYINSLVLNSNRSLRSFIHLLKQSIQWEIGNDYPYVAIEKSRRFKIDAEILEAIDNVIDMNFDEKGNGYNDFLITQMHLAIRKMKLKKVNFKKEDLYNKDSEKYPIGYWERVDILVDMLLEEMTSYKLIEKLENTPNTYQWKKDVSVFFKPEFIVATEDFTTRLRNVKDILEGIYIGVFKIKLGEDIGYKIREYTPVNFLLQELKEAGITIKKEYEDKFMEVIKVENFIINGDEYCDISLVRSASRFLLDGKSAYITAYISFIFQEILPNHRLIIENIIPKHLNLIFNYDFIAISDDQSPNFLVKIIYMENVNASFYDNDSTFKRGLEVVKRYYEKDFKQILIICVPNNEVKDSIYRALNSSSFDQTNTTGINHIVVVNLYRNTDINITELLRKELEFFK